MFMLRGRAGCKGPCLRASPFYFSLSTFKEGPNRNDGTKYLSRGSS